MLLNAFSLSLIIAAMCVKMLRSLFVINHSKVAEAKNLEKKPNDIETLPEEEKMQTFFRTLSNCIVI